MWIEKFVSFNCIKKYIIKFYAGKFQYFKYKTESFLDGSCKLKKQLTGTVHLKKMSGIKGNIFMFPKVNE